MDRLTDQAAHQSPLGSNRESPGYTPPALDWRKKMSDHVAYALLLYTALQIFMTIGALKSHGGSLMPYFALVLLVVAIIPACRRFEARWSHLTDEEARDPALAPRYRRDRLAVWLLAIGLPFALTALFKCLSVAFASQGSVAGLA